uniref:Uncharacterized protein n=1 Tax=Salix viminalis TaxID=40686 RepID=A0A6N2KYH4_SALVM
MLAELATPECEAEVKTVLGGDSMWVLIETAGGGRDTSNVNGVVAETESIAVFPGGCYNVSIGKH